MEIQAWYLYSHTAYLSHIMSIHFQLCLFVLSSAQAVVQWLTTCKVKAKNNRSLPLAFRGHQQERIILCLVCGQSGQSQWNGMSALCCLSWRYQEKTDVLQTTTIHIHSLFTTTDCGHLSCSLQEKLSNWKLLSTRTKLEEFKKYRMISCQYSTCLWTVVIESSRTNSVNC